MFLSYFKSVKFLLKNDKKIHQNVINGFSYSLFKQECFYLFFLSIHSFIHSLCIWQIQEQAYIDFALRNKTESLKINIKGSLTREIVQSLLGHYKCDFEDT